MHRIQKQLLRGILSTPPTVKLMRQKWREIEESQVEEGEGWGVGSGNIVNISLIRIFKYFFFYLLRLS